jgi:DNA polymerase I-like protein with 3'-5' exonuclease and polymerase domains
VRPPQNDLKRLSELGIHEEEFYSDLREELARIKPNVVLALGGAALKAMTQLQGIISWRGSILESSHEFHPHLKVIPSINPAAVLRQYKWKPLLVLDVKRVKKESETAKIELLKRNLSIRPNFTDAMMYIKWLTERVEKIAFDIEVDIYGLMSCIAFSADPRLVVCIPFRNGYNSYWTEGEEYSIWRMMRELFHTPGKLWIAQNCLFDMKWLIRKVGYFTIWMDTMLAHQLLYAEIPKGLDTLASIYTTEPYYKDERKVWKDTTITEQLWKYNAKDAAVTIEVALRLEEEMKALKQEDFFFGFVMKLIPVMLKLQLRGIKVDMAGREGIRQLLEKEEKELESLIPVNVRSSQQMKKYLYEEMGFKPQIHHKTGKVSTGKEALNKLRRKI